MVFGRGSRNSDSAASPGDTDAAEVVDVSLVDGESPCEPCKAAAEARQFSLNAPAVPALADDRVPRIAPGVSTDIGDAGVDLTIDSSERTYRLNATAGVIWLTIDGQLDIAGIIADLVEETGAPAEQIGPDVRGSISTFADQGLITID